MAVGKTGRDWWVATHRWLGLGLGVIVAFLGLTGSLIVFFNETEQVLDPTMFVGTSGDATPPDALLAAVAEAYPDLGPPRDILYVRNVSDFPPIVTTSGPSGPVEVTVDARTGEVLGRRETANSLMWWLFDLHASLGFSRFGATETGKLIAGTSGVLMLMLAASGLVVWWPRNRRFRIVMSIKAGASGHRLAMDMHRAIAIYSFVILVPVTATGIYFAKPDWIIPLLGVFGPARQYPPVTVATPACGPPITPSEALAAARAIRPDAVLARIILSRTPDQPYSVAFFHPESPRHIHGGSEHIQIDPTCGTILEVRSRAHSAQQTATDWLLPIHGGEAFGLVGRILVFLAGIVPAFLLVTGTLIYMRRRKARLATSGRHILR